MTDLALRSWRSGAKPDYFASRARGPVLSENRNRRPLETARTRLLVAGAVFALCFAVLGSRIIDLSLLGGADANRPTAHAPTATLTLARADIVDRNGTLLATNLPAPSLYVDPTMVLDAEEAADKLRAALPELDRDTIIQRATAGGRFVWIKRNLTPNQHYEINRLGLPGFGFVREERRVYPHGPLFAHALGFTGVDNHGLSGLEKAIDEALSDPTEARRAPVALSFDVRVQHALHDELSAAVADFRAKGAAGIVLDVDTGEVLAMVSLPDFDPNAPTLNTAAAHFNRASLGVYELGSTFKTFTTAMALDYGVVGLNDGYDATKPIRIAGYAIRDDHPKNRWLSVPEIFVYSSNIGAAKMAADVGTTRQRAFLDKLGMFAPIAIELPETGRPLTPKHWREINTLTVAFGHGIAVTPLHLIDGFATIVNGGIRRAPTLLKRDLDAPTDGTQVIRPETSAIMRRLLHLVVTDGTGKQAAVAGYLVGGKTGTAEKAVNGRYKNNALLSTFVAAFPMNAPRYAVLAMLDEPRGNESTFGFASAGWTAAPVVGRVISRIAPLLGVEPVNEEIAPGRNDLVVHINGRSRQLASF